MRTNRSQQGAAAIEFVIILPVFITLSILFLDVSRYFLLQGKLNHTSYSLATMVAHRQQFYLDAQNQPVELNQEQANQLLAIASRLLSDNKLGVSVHQVYRPEADDTGYKHFTSGATCSNKSSDQLRQFYLNINDANLDAKQSLFVVELCKPINGFSWFAKFADAADFGQLYASSVMVER